MWEQVADGTGIASLSVLSLYENEFDEGQRGRLSLLLSAPAPSSLVNELGNKLVDAGVAEVQVGTSGNFLYIQFRKGFPWLAVIAATIIGLIALAILIVSWQLFREVPTEWQGIALFIFLVTLSIGALALLIWMVKK